MRKIPKKLIITDKELGNRFSRKYTMPSWGINIDPLLVELTLTACLLTKAIALPKIP
jgi:hypothetical protein